LGVVAVDGKIYAIGGTTELGYEPSSVVGTNECYDPGSDMWTTLEPMPTPRTNFAIATYEGKIYCIGGYTAEQVPPYSPISVIEVYDIATNSWSTKTSMPVEGAMYACVVNGNFFVMTKYDLFMYDPVEDFWTQKTFMPQKISISPSSEPHSVSVVVDDKIVVTGYFEGIHSEPKTRIYDPATDVWSEGSAPAKPYWFNLNCAGVTTGVYAPQSVYVLGGTSEGITELSNQVYDPVGDTWAFAKDMSAYRCQFGVVVINDILYVVGGHYTDGVVVSTNEQYIPMGYNGTLSLVTSPSVIPETSNLSSSIYLIAAILVIIVGTLGTGLFFYSKKSKQ